MSRSNTLPRWHSHKVVEGFKITSSVRVGKNRTRLVGQPGMTATSRGTTPGSAATSFATTTGT